MKKRAVNTSSTEKDRDGRGGEYAHAPGEFVGRLHRCLLRRPIWARKEIQ